MDSDVLPNERGVVRYQLSDSSRVQSPRESGVSFQRRVAQW